MIFAVVPACGRSVRMGRPKLALPLGERTVLEHAVGALCRGGVDQVLVVVGPHVPQLVPLATAAGAAVFLLTEETADMRATVECGLRWLEERYAPWPEDAWFLAPGDHPTLDASIVDHLLQVRRNRPDRSLFVPSHEGKRGHPTLIGWEHVPAILTLPLGVGLNVYLRAQSASLLEVDVRSPEILCDLDTPEDYDRVRRRFPTLPEA